MTEPVARAASPRRTVRVAAALVAGQAVLCAVIGWVTFGSSEAPPPAATGQADPLAGPPIALPTASMLLPVPVAPPTTTVPVRPRSRAATERPPKPPPRPATTPQTPAATTEDRPTTTATTETTAPPTAPMPPEPDLAATMAPTPTPEVQTGAVEGEPCDPPGALGLTADDVKVRCVRGDDGRASWQII